MKKLTIIVGLVVGLISYSGYSQCCTAQTNSASKTTTSAAKKDTSAKICKKCGEVAGSKKCCDPKVAKCKKCGLNKGSAGCCKINVQSTCPVTGEKLTNKKFFIDTKGKRIYACCPGCIAKIKADPDKYIKKLEDKGITIQKAPEQKK